MKKSPSKTFRLFISSTFSDFKEERNILQTEVFPIVKTYAVKQGYTFQPIDLRWGVNNEAQLDQKALELCLSEVKACKTHMYPNFLIMAGDRYGWVPLPYAIEKEEFETIYDKAKEKKLLDDWYKLDKNQLPSSYILQKREGQYKDYDSWVAVENKLRDALQAAIELANLPEEQSRKYFLSATEAEVEEGIIPYHKPTEFQASTLLKENPDLVKVDPKHIFGFLREVDMESKQGDMFIPNKEEWEKAGEFKDRLRENITSENILEVTTKQTDKKHLDIAYLKKFKERIIEFLKNQIDTHKQQENERNYSPLEIELEAQNYYALNKRKGFLQTEPLKNLLSDINNYVDYREKSEPFILYGASGRGKSALMAQAIDEAQNRLKERVVYRFIGATPYANSSQEILISIFDELGINLRSQEQKDFQKNNESFEEFSNRVYHTILNLDKDVVIFIDALDQLQNDDQFLWLPKQLSANVKIILSCLNDENYKDDTKYFNTLQEKFANLHEIPPFNEPIALLKQLLKEEYRTLSEDQENDFLKQYEKVNAPLYIVMASREIKTWRSDDTNQTLASTQKGIIEEFIVNLNKVHNHDEKFVHKVLGYIYASRDGVSESELFELLATDEKFIEHVAPETFHENPNHELPLSHWSRLQAELKPFLSIKEQDNEELMYFFHREFEDAVANQEQQKEEHEAIIKATQKKILQTQDQKFNENRWGRLYITLITEYELRYKDKEKQQEFAEFIADTEKLNENWIQKCITKINRIGLEHNTYYRMLQAIAYQETFKYVLESLYQKNPIRWAKGYITSLDNLSYSYANQNRLDKAIEFGQTALDISEDLYEKNPDRWGEIYIEILTSLAEFYKHKQHFDKALKVSERAFEINKEIVDDSYFILCKDIGPLIYLAEFYEKLYSLDEAIELLENELVEIDYDQVPLRCRENYRTVLTVLVDLYGKQNRLDETIVLVERILEISEELYVEDPDRWVTSYIRSRTDLADFYIKQNRLDEAIEFGQTALDICEDLYEKDPDRWGADYTMSLYNLAILYDKQNRLDEAIEFGQTALDICEDLYEKDPDRWAEFYTRELLTVAGYYTNYNRFDESTEILERALKIMKPVYQKDPARWVELYATVLGNLSKQYTLDQIIELAERALKISEELYETDPNKWVKDYIVVLYYFSLLYSFAINDVKTSIRLAKRRYEVSKQHKDCDTMDALIIYLFMLSKSRLVWGVFAFMLIGIIFIILYFN